MADDSPLGELVPLEPEELLTRGAVGAPGRLRIEVGLSEPRFARPAGRRTSVEEMALRRALGGVTYPADRDRLLAEAGRWLVGHDGLQSRLRGLPELTYGGELEVLRRLSQPTSDESEQEVELRVDQPAELERPSTLPGKVEGSSESR
ncbi:MAG TPA: hypothetical protein VMW80_06910 [Candidatus Dormibacteraeota bacterium]|nr:hypothetical protein [Candidatus Dormibacteraeota bacterium]